MAIEVVKIGHHHKKKLRKDFLTAYQLKSFSAPQRLMFSTPSDTLKVPCFAYLSVTLDNPGFRLWRTQKKLFSRLRHRPPSALTARPSRRPICYLYPDRLPLKSPRDNSG